MPARRAPSRSRRALTLLELLLAVAITTIVGLAMATAMTATARGMTTAGDARSAVQRAHVAYVRLRSYTSQALALLQADPSRGFAVWLQDDVPANKVNLSELRCFWFDASAGTLSVELMALPDSWTPEMVEAHDIELDPDADFLAVMLDQRGLGYTQTEILTEGLDNLEIIFDGDDPKQSRRFRVALTIAATDSTENPVLMTFGLVNHQPPR